MRIAYGVHGYGRGHAVRVGALLPALAARHEVHLFAGGAAHDALRGAFGIPHLAYAYRGGRVSILRTVARNAGTVLDLVAGGTVSQIVAGRLRALAPDLVVSDSEPFLLRAARAAGIPVVSLDHVGVIAHCRFDAPWRDRPRLALDGTVYRLLLGGADRVILSSFFRPAVVPGHVEIVPPILRGRVLQARPADGDRLLVYFNAPRLITPSLRAALAGLGRPVVVYGSGLVGREGGVIHRAFDEAAFVDDLASCRALLATGGHQLISEALHLGKPMLLYPEATAEQRLNAREAERLGAARIVRRQDLTIAGLRRLLDQLPRPGAITAPYPPYGEVAAVAVLERAAAELAPSRARASVPARSGPSARSSGDREVTKARILGDGPAAVRPRR